MSAPAIQLQEITIKRKQSGMSETIETEVTIKALPDESLDDLQARAERMAARQVGMRVHSTEVIYPNVLFSITGQVEASDAVEVRIEDQ